jgi:pSer/pThr/pTyr-binding forkhead associated (FHA) protein
MEVFKPTIINLKTHEKHQLFDGMTIGRGRSSDINIDDTKVSRIHLTIRFINDRELIIEDSSSNGTFINNEKINGQHKISNDSTIRMGTSELKVTFRDENKAPETHSQEIKSTPKVKLVKGYETSYDHYPPAPFFKRLISILIDGTLIGIAGKVIDVLVSQAGFSELNTSILGFFAQITGGTYYYYYFLNKNYQTVGKKAMKLMVVPTDKRKRFSVFRILGREIFLKGFLGFISIFTVLFSKEHLAAHDYINKTRVIDVSKG